MATLAGTAPTGNTTAPFSSTTAYDLQRQRIQDEERKRQKAQQEALQRRLSTSGFQQGSGQTELQSRRLQQEMSEEERARLRDVDIVQAQLEEQARQAEMGRGLTREQMAQQSEQFGQTQGLTREQMAQQAGQFGLTQEQERYLQGQQITEAQRAQQATIQAAQQQQQKQIEHESKMEQGRLTATYAQIASTEGIAAAERDLQSKLASDEMAQRKAEYEGQMGYQYTALTQDAAQFARSMGLQEAEAQRAADQFAQQMAWEQQSYYDTQNFAMTQQYMDQRFQKDLASINNQYATGLVELESSLKMDEEGKRLQWDALYRRGLNGEVVNTSKMSPNELAAYQSGLSGARKDEYDRRMQEQLDLRNNMIINASEPEVVDRVLDIYAQWGITPWYPGQTTNTNTRVAYAAPTPAPTPVTPTFNLNTSTRTVTNPFNTNWLLNRTPITPTIGIPGRTTFPPTIPTNTGGYTPLVSTGTPVYPLNTSGVNPVTWSPAGTTRYNTGYSLF
jgi:hypothetical protein